MSEATAIKLLDEVLVLFDLYKEDYNTVRDSLEAIARYAKEHPEHPITLSLYNFLRDAGYLADSNRLPDSAPPGITGSAGTPGL